MRWSGATIVRVRMAPFSFCFSLSLSLSLHMRFFVRPLLFPVLFYGKLMIEDL